MASNSARTDIFRSFKVSTVCPASSTQVSSAVEIRAAMAETKPVAVVVAAAAATGAIRTERRDLGASSCGLLSTFGNIFAVLWTRAQPLELSAARPQERSLTYLWSYHVDIDSRRRTTRLSGMIALYDYGKRGIPNLPRALMKTDKAMARTSVALPRIPTRRSSSAPHTLLERENRRYKSGFLRPVLRSTTLRNHPGTPSKPGEHGVQDSILSYAL